MVAKLPPDVESDLVSAMRDLGRDLFGQSKPPVPGWTLVPKHKSRVGPTSMMRSMRPAMVLTPGTGTMRVALPMDQTLQMQMLPREVVALFEPALVLEGLLMLRANLNKDTLHFSSRAEFEAVQLRVEELIRQYQNLV